MIAFHGKQEVKKKYLNRVIEHIRMDSLVRGVTYENKNGKIRACAVGCTLEKYDHKAYEEELGIPEWLARLEDTLFENMSVEKSKTWPKDFLKAIKPGANLENAKKPFLVMVLKSTLKSIDACKYDAEKYPDVAKAIAGSKVAVKKMIKAHENGDPSAARSAAWSAARSAAYDYCADELLKILMMTS